MLKWIINRFKRTKKTAVSVEKYTEDLLASNEKLLAQYSKMMTK